MSRPQAAGRPAREALAAVLLTASLAGAPLALRGIWPPDETRYAAVAQSMLESGQVVVPRLDGEVYAEKPPVFFWAAAALRKAGVPLEAAPRLVSALSAVGVVALVPGIGAALGLSSAVSARGALLLATAPLFLAYAQMGLLDAWLTLLVALAIAAKLLRRGSGRLELAVVEGLALGAGLLTKGPVTLLFPLGLRAGALLDGRRSAARPDGSDLLALAVAGGVSLLWLGAAWREEGRGYVLGITLGQIAQRAGVEGHTPHREAPGFLIAAAALGLLPWTLYAGRACGRLRRAAERSTRNGVGALLGWLAPVAGLALLPSQQPHYALPALPAAALLLAHGTLEPSSRALRGGLAALGGALALLLLGLGAGGSAWVPPGGSTSEALSIALADPIFRAVAVAAGLAVAALVATRRRDAPARTVRRLAAGAAVLFAAAVLLASRADPQIAPRALLQLPAVQSARRVAAPSSLCHLIRLADGQRDVEVLDKDAAFEALQREPGMVALVWPRDLRRRLAPEPEQRASLEVIGRGFVQGRRVLAVRARRAEPPRPAMSRLRGPGERP